MRRLWRDFNLTEIARSFVGFSQIMPKGLEGIVGPLVIGVAGKHDDENNEIDPTKGIHLSSARSFADRSMEEVTYNRR